MGRIATLTANCTCCILAVMVIICLLFTLGQVSASSSSSSSSSVEALEKPSMEVRIDQPQKRSMDNCVHYLPSNVLLVNMTGVLVLRLDCWAPYPIDLRFYGHLTNQETTVKTFRKDFGPPDKPKSWFIINATMETYEQVTGNYTCFSVEHPHLLSSYYIFVSPTLPGVLLTRGQHIRVQVKPEENRVVLPCAVSHPGVHVQLFRNEDNVTPHEEGSYDPKVGFSLDLNLQDPSVFGNYSCRTELSSKDRVNFTLVPPQKFRVTPKINHLQILPNEQLNISCDATEDFVMEYVPPTLKVLQNKVTAIENPDEYYQYRGRFVSAQLSRKESGYVHCKWKDSDAMFASWSFAVLDKEMKKPGELDSKNLISACRNASHLIVYECSNPVECRINSCLRKDSQCQSNGQICVAQRDEQCVQNGLIQCAAETSSVMEIFFTGFPTPKLNKTTRYVGWENVSVDELLLLKQVPSQPQQPRRHSSMKQPSVKKFTCQGSNFVFSSGFKWIVYFKDKSQLSVTSLNDLTQDKMNVTVRNYWKEKKSNLESTLRIYQDKMSTKRVAFIECQAPVWNSWQWISRKIPVENSANLIGFSKTNLLWNMLAIFFVHLIKF